MPETVKVEHRERGSHNPLFNVMKKAAKATANTVKTAGKVTASTVKTAGKATGNTFKAAGNVVVHPLGGAPKKTNSSSKSRDSVKGVHKHKGAKKSSRRASTFTSATTSASTVSRQSTTTSTHEEVTFTEPRTSSVHALLAENKRSGRKKKRFVDTEESSSSAVDSAAESAASEHLSEKSSRLEPGKLTGKSLRLEPGKLSENSLRLEPKKRSEKSLRLEPGKLSKNSLLVKPGKLSKRAADARKQNQTKHPVATVNKAANDDDNALPITDDVKGADYYYGLIPKSDVEPLLTEEGDFLLRESEVDGKLVLAVSVRDSDVIRHFIVNRDPDGSFFFDSHHENGVLALIDYYVSSKETLTGSANAKLSRPVGRPPWLLSHDSILAVKKLGAGAFGEVFLAEHTTGEETIQVAIKTMRAECDSNSRLKFMKEARLMRRFLHPHLVRIYGVAVHELPLIIVMEFCPGGGLDSYLKKNKGIVTPEEKLRFATEAAEGLAYVHEQGCIHRDVAARNVLLSSNLEVKISDFGMSLDTPEFHAAKLQKVPIKWLAPETMKGKLYSRKTDVWSFGILVWEIYADGATPYPGLNNVQTRAFVLQNSRMTMPQDTQLILSIVVSQCWLRNPDLRPEFSVILKSLKPS